MLLPQKVCHPNQCRQHLFLGCGEGQNVNKADVPHAKAMGPTVVLQDFVPHWCLFHDRRRLILGAFSNQGFSLEGNEKFALMTFFDRAIPSVSRILTVRT